MARKKRRGRPLTYEPIERRRIAELIRQHGASGARGAMSRPICNRTLLSIAREFGIELKKGRRPRQAA